MNLNVDDSVQRDLRTLVHFIRLYCDEKHAAAPRSPVQLAGFDMPALAGADELCLCESCSKLLKHALVKRSHCPMQPKPACKHCPSHCYHPTYRAQIREVMAFSGRKLVLRGRLDYLLHLLF